MFASRILFLFEKLVKERFTLFSDTAEPDLVS